MQVYGGLINRIMETTVNAPTPVAGMGATLLSHSDRRPYTIHKVEGKKLWATEDKSTRTDKNGMSESQEYVYETLWADSPESWSLFTLRKDGQWHEGTKLSGHILAIGKRDSYHDFSF